MTAKVRTVRGDIESGGLGFTHCHEHLFVLPVEGVDLPDRLIFDDYEKAKSEVELFRREGGKTLVDLQPFGAGRHARLLHQLSGETGVNIVAATGFHKLFFYPEFFWSRDASASDMTDLFVSEIKEGMYAYHRSSPFEERSSVKAGVIKIATEKEGLTPYYTKIFEAAAWAHAETGAPVITHTELSTFGIEQTAFLIRNGVPPEHIIISHMDRVIDLEDHLRLADLGVFLDYDTIARYKYHSDEEEVRLIKTMADRGHAGRIVFGMDSTRDRFRSYGADIGLDYIGRTFVPMLKRKGVSDGDIELMTVINPGKALSLAARRR